MKKRYLALPLIAGVAGASWAGTTLYGGNEARDAYETLLSDLSAASGLGFVEASWEAGFLSSTAVTELRTTPDDVDSTVLRLRHVIEHSPVGGDGLRAARIVTTASFPAGGAVSPVLRDAFGDQAPATITSRVALDGSAEHSIEVAPWSLPTALGPVRAEALAWQVSQASDGSVSGTGQWPGLVFASEGGDGTSVTLGGSHDRFDIAPGAPGVYVGSYTAELGDVTIDSAGTGLSASLSGLSLTSTSEQVGDTLRGDAVLSVASMDVPIELDSMRLAVDFRGWPVAGMEELRTTGNEVNLASFADDQAKQADAVRGYLTAAADYVRPGMGFVYALELGNAGGEAKAELDVEYTGAPANASLDTLGDLVGTLVAQATLNVDAAAVGMTPATMFVNPAALAPWVVSDADGYRADIRIEDLAMNVNGEVLPLLAMAGGLLDMPLQPLLEDALLP